MPLLTFEMWTPVPTIMGLGQTVPKLGTRYLVTTNGKTPL